MIADPPPKATRLDVGFDRKAPQNREAWKQAIGQQADQRALGHASRTQAQLEPPWS